MTEAEFRQRIVDEAKSWIGTPYRLGSCLKGVGVDCAQFVAAVYKAAGIMPAEDKVEIFTHDWFLHTVEERYLLRVVKYARKMMETQVYQTTQASPGNLVLTKAAASRVYNHAGIVVAWPKIIHAVDPKVELISACVSPLWAFQQIVILDPWKQNDREN